MDLIAFFEPFLVLFVLIALGVLVAHWRILDAHGAAQISSLVIEVTLPAAIFVAVASEMSPEMLLSAPLVVLLGVALGGLTYALGRLLARARGAGEDQRGVYAFAAGCSNTGFLGIPLVGAVFGPIAAVTAALYDFSTTINMFTFGVAGLERQGRLDLRRLARNLFNPMFVALLLAVAWSATGWKLPSFALRLLRLVGDSTAPLAMIALGHMLYSARGEASWPLLSIGLIGALRLFLAPALALVVVGVLPITAQAKAVCALQAGMPTAMLTPILARQYGADHRLGLSAALSSTLAALVTLPLLAFVARWLFGLG